jgi:hypothetical protein
MNATGQRDLYLIKQELQNIINEMDNIANGIYSDFEGIGNDKCFSKLNKLAEHYRNVKKKLNHIDTSKVTAQFAKSHGGGR